MTPSPQESLPITDLASGMALLNRLPLAVPSAAESELCRFLDALIAGPLEGDELFPLLEQARVPLCFVEEEMARLYHNKPIPLAELEDQAFSQVLLAWQKMARAYALCAERTAADPGNPSSALRIATILHRCIYYTGNQIIEYFRARRELPPGLWLDLHGYYASAEEWGVDCLPVADALDHDQQSTHCAAAYVTLLLIDAGSPYSRSVRDLNLIRRWAARWAPLVSLQALTDDIEVPPFIIELLKDSGLHPTAYDEIGGNDARQIDTSRLGLQIQQTLTQLRQRITPSKLGLGEESTSHVSTLLLQLARPWTQTAAARRFRRFPRTGVAQLANGFDAIFFFVTGQDLVQPDAAETYSRAQFDTLFTFRHQVDPARTPTPQQAPEYPVDRWEILNHSAQGFRLARSCAGQKLVHGQLLAIHPDDAPDFILAQASWLMQETSGGLIAGLSLFPGRPQGVAVRSQAPGSSRFDRFVRAFLLPPLQAIDEESSLILPTGLYQASQTLEIAAGGDIFPVRMKSLLQRGSDFDRVSYEKI